MDKKNTMLLTVIAVATLLVAVVGATFAYFSVTGSNTSSSTSLQTTTKEVGTVTLTDSGIDLYLNPTAAQMAKSEAGHSFYSTTTNDDAVTTATPALLATFALSGAHSGDKYECSFSYSISSTSSTQSPYDALTAADGSITLTAGSGIIGIPASTTLYDTKAGVSGTGKIQFTADSNGTASATITGYAQWNNLADAEPNDGSGNQNTRAALAMTTSFDITALDCDTVANFSSNS